MTEGIEQLDLGQIRERLAAAQGRHYWRSLEEVARTPAFEQFLQTEFPGEVTRWTDHVSRRNFLKVMGASVALAGLSSCTKPPNEKIVPYVRPPEQVIPGKSLFFATAMPFGGIGRGLLVESHEGRPTKIEGNPDHPESLGASNVFMQAAILNLYDPDRAQVVTHAGEPSDWSSFRVALARALQGQPRLRILTDTITSPTLAAQIDDLLKRIPSSKWHQYDPIGRDNLRAGVKAATGSDGAPVYHLSKAKVVLALDSDFLFADAGSVRYARRFMDGRRVAQQGTDGPRTMNRLYVVEGSPTITGSVADHRLPLTPSQIDAFARALATELGVNAGGAPTSQGAALRAWIEPLAEDLKSNRGQSVILVGEGQGPEVHALAHMMNAALGNVGKTVDFIDAIEAHPATGAASLKELADDLRAGSVDMLLILGGNPVYNAPVDIEFEKALRDFSSAKDSTGNFIHFSARLGLNQDETALLCQWDLPDTHFLEMWGDVRAYDGTVSIIQPLISPLYQGKSAHDLLSIMGASLASNPASEQPGYEIVREYWQKQHTGADFDMWWQEALRKGVIEGTALKAQTVQVRGAAAPAATVPVEAALAGNRGLEIVFKPDYSVWDGAFANNGWLQEIARPLTHLTWDNAALISPRTAERLGLRLGDEGGVTFLKITSGDRDLEIPAWILPGQADEVITLNLGYGRSRAGRNGTSTAENPVGFNAYALRTSDQPWIAGDVKVEKLEKVYELVATHTHHSIESRRLKFVNMEPEVIARPAPGADHDSTDADHDHGPTVAEAEADLNNRKLIRTATLAELNSGDDNLILDMDEATAEGTHQEREDKKNHPLQLFPEHDYPAQKAHGYPGYKWGMSIDLTTCIACNACVVACQSENNIPVVGTDQVSRGREMNWIRIDTYYGGSLDNPETFHEPVPCMQCENAPCELVCPVGATVHDDEGINNMVYNRCVGTRYCSNNCPYKVRRFNFYQYSDQTTESLKLMNNPNVTVRSRGVMEKCTYCIQRINETRMDIEKTVVRYEERAARTATEEARQKILRELNGDPADGAKLAVPGLRQKMLNQLQTACQQACPTEAIVFGDLNDTVGPDGRGSLARQLHDHALDYSLLEELNTIPRTRYLARITNPNPKMPLEGGAA